MPRGLYANINAKQARIAAGSGEKMNKPGSKGAVVFNDELVKILRKYGISGLGLSGGAALGGGLITDQQQTPAPSGL
jgi:hypothetical protein